MYVRYPDAKPSNEAEARAALEKAGVLGVVVMRPVSVGKEIGSTPETYSDPIYSGYWGAYYAAKYGSSSIRAGGSIVFTSGIAGRRPHAGWSLGASICAAMEGLTRALAVELAPRRITVNCVAPGVIETDMSREIREAAAEEVKSRILLRRFGAPHDVAYAVWFLASRYADYVTGQVLHVDGGFKME